MTTEDTSRCQDQGILNRGWFVVTWGGYSLRARKRSVLVAGLLLFGFLVLFICTLMQGSTTHSALQVWHALWGQGEESVVRSVQSRRLPRLLTAAMVGASLGLSGAIFQSVSRNALGSPDIIGFTAGASAGAVFQITVFGGGTAATAMASIAGGLVAAALVYGLSRRDGVTGGLRLVLVGIGMASLLTAFSAFLMVRADMDKASAAQLWTSGSLTGRGWEHAGLAAIGLAVILPLLVLASRPLAYAEMGDDVAAGVGIDPERLRLIVIFLGVVLVGIAIAAAGPIAFIALAAPQIAKRVGRIAGPGLALSGAVGAVLLIIADGVSQLLSWQVKTPVGYVTSLVGGVYLVLLLARKS